VIPSLDRRAPFQLAFVVPDLEDAVRRFDLVGAGPWRGWLFGPQGQGREHRGTPAEWTLRLALTSGSPQYELVEPVGGPSIHAEWLRDRGGGFHHVGYVVESFAQTTSEMAAAGYPAVGRIHSFGADGDGEAAYFDTVETLGFYVEAVVPPAQMPPVEFTL
jgi:hypothetical protein